ncbi:E3 ubiquitin protein ligase [Pseudoloma neurophilia]|uniref:HECT-type E3 ubiquitin transferase n=1 Tax=Pseudoloma neurophilia TaxID=146866 RepID=A0A0R0M439_9MICR|nr:E3 ubiquitin protein ligase [Pseudoloma neurophilia]
MTAVKAKLQDEYVRQLYIGCDNVENCANFFCKSEIQKTYMYKIAKYLSNYGRLFFCNYKNSQDTIYRLNSKRRGHIVLDLYIFVVFPEIKLFEKEDRLKEHKFCQFFKQGDFSDEEKILIEGVLALLLKKYIESDDINLSYVIIRVLSEVLLKVDLKNNIFLNLSDVFLNIDKLVRELQYSITEDHVLDQRKLCLGDTTQLNRSTKDTCKISSNDKNQRKTALMSKNTEKFVCKDCLFSDYFKEQDLTNLILRFQEFFNTKELKSLRSSKKVEELLNIFHILFYINEKTGITSFMDFYLEKFCFAQNFQEEIRLNKSSYKTLIKYPFILPISLKSEFIKSENNDMMKNKLQDAFFTALFIGETAPYFFITVNRNNLYDDMFRLLMEADDSEIRKEIKITFEGEEGVDSGGITKEFFQLISDELVQDDYLFKLKNNVLWFSKEIKTKKYEIVGKLVGLALYNDVILNIPFPTFLFKIFLNKKPDLNDLSEIEPEICKSLKQILNYTEEELKMLEQCFSINRNGKIIELVPNGKNILVDIHNRDSFVTRYSEYIMLEEMEMNIDGLKRGFLSVIQKNIISFLQPSELEKIIVGCSTINVGKLQETAAYSGFASNSPLVVAFWQIFEQYSSDEQKSLLMFITGNERVPVGNNPNSKLIIVRNGCDTDRLPSSQTCFNTLLLPEYSSGKKLREKLTQAISMTKGFFLL